MKIFKQHALQIHALHFTILFALYFAFVINIPILISISHTLNRIYGNNITAYCSVAVAIFCIMNLIFLLLSLRYIVKPLFILILLISTFLSYATYSYGTIFNSEMLQNILQTHYSESTSYLTSTFFIWLTAMGIIPSILIYKIKIVFPSYLKETLQKLTAALLTFVLLIIAVAPGYKGYASVIRNNPQLQKMLIPTQWAYTLGLMVKNIYFTKKIDYRLIGLDATNRAKPLADRPNHHLPAF